MDEALAPTRHRKASGGHSLSAIWTKEEDDLLIKLVGNDENISWSSIVRHFRDKNPSQLAGRWDKVLNPALIKGSWTREEDQVIIDFVSVNGEKDWAKLALMLPSRIGKQCRERWKNHLDPKVIRKEWTQEEDELLIQLHQEYGNSWRKISLHFSGRTDNCVKNRWNSTLKKRIERIANGEPLLFKRGRKPKRMMEMPIIPDLIINDENPSSNSSPKVGSNVKPSIIHLVPIAEQLSIRSPTGNKDVYSLSENRNSLSSLLSHNNNPS